ncbi:MAG TPA: low molecular weight protein-tyrosine-phosphatase [Dokdonella sp.]
MTRILFICMGNICRSPIVESVARVEFARAGIAAEIASAGTENYHVGQRADERAIAIAEAHGYPLAAHRARQLQRGDFERYEHLLVMDRVNLRASQRVRPAQGGSTAALFLDHAGLGAEEVPDPYYGTSADFEHVVALAREGVAAMIRRLTAAAAGVR